MATSSETSDQNNVKSRRPAESAFKQQRLPAWQPILTAGTVLPTFFVIGIAFIPVGIGLLYFSDEVKEHVIDYTQCLKKDEGITCADYIKQTNMSMETKCICEMDFNLTEDFKAEVFFYYGLSNFYQNHRRYVKSRDDEQLLGRLDRPLSSDCDPFAERQGKPVAPCGAIANSMFNDTLTLFSQDQQMDVPVNRTGIAWKSDKDIKFRNPDTTPYNGSLKAAFANFTKPNNWAVNVWELDLTDENNNGFQNEDLIVWMRTAALPTFRKLYRRVDHTRDYFRAGLKKGLYTLKIEYNYPVTEFDGTKSFVISTTSLLGGKNPFLGVAYVVVGTLCLLLGIVLLVIHVRCSKRYYATPTESFFLDIDTDPNGTTGAAINAIIHRESARILYDNTDRPISNFSVISFPNAKRLSDPLLVNDKHPNKTSTTSRDDNPLYPPDASELKTYERQPDLHRVSQISSISEFPNESAISFVEPSLTRRRNGVDVAIAGGSKSKKLKVKQDTSRSFKERLVKLFSYKRTKTENNAAASAPILSTVQTTTGILPRVDVVERVIKTPDASTSSSDHDNSAVTKKRTADTEKTKPSDTVKLSSDQKDPSPDQINTSSTQKISSSNKENPLSTQKIPSYTQENPLITQQIYSSTQKNPPSTQNIPVSTQKILSSTQNIPSSGQKKRLSDGQISSPKENNLSSDQKTVTSEQKIASNDLIICSSDQKNSSSDNNTSASDQNTSSDRNNSSSDQNNCSHNIQKNPSSDQKNSDV